MNPLYIQNNNMMSQLKAQALKLKNSIPIQREQLQQLLNSGKSEDRREGKE
jgi:DNA-binding Xre family transcriptional regulator